MSKTGTLQQSGWRSVVEWRGLLRTPQGLFHGGHMEKQTTDQAKQEVSTLVLSQQFLSKIELNIRCRV